MSINHIIITRFNIQYEKEDSVGIQLKWLDDRLHLFEKYCLPSIQRQTYQEFTWLLLCDIRTPEQYKTRIENYCSILPQLRIYWLPYQDDSYHTFYKKMGKEYTQNHTVLISTRLDNDDALADNYIESIQKIAQTGVIGIISFPLGRQIFINENRSYNILYTQNHFLSYIETANFDTIMVFDHTAIPSCSIQTIETSIPMWEEIVHGNNIANGYYPNYHYIIQNGADLLDLCGRWIYFQTKRSIRFLKRYIKFL